MISFNSFRTFSSCPGRQVLRSSRRIREPRHAHAHAEPQHQAPRRGRGTLHILFLLLPQAWFPAVERALSTLALLVVSPGGGGGGGGNPSLKRSQSRSLIPLRPRLPEWCEQHLPSFVTSRRIPGDWLTISTPLWSSTRRSLMVNVTCRSDDWSFAANHFKTPSPPSSLLLTQW